MPPLIPINLVNAAIFPVQQRCRRYFSSSTLLTPLFSSSTPLMPLFIQINVVNAAIFQVQQRYRRYFSSSTPLTPLFSVSPLLMPLFFRFSAVKAAFFWFNAVKAAVFQVQRCQRRYIPFRHRHCRCFSNSTPITPLSSVHRR